jgi:histidine ammonia-lyase
VRAAIAHVREVVAVELNGVTDSPTFFPEEDAVLHAGNFHGQPVAMAVDHLKVAPPRSRLLGAAPARLLDPATSGGLPFLIRERRAQRPTLLLRQLDGCRQRGPRASTRLGADQRQQPGRRRHGLGRDGTPPAARERSPRVAIELLAAAEPSTSSGRMAGGGTRAVHARVRQLVARSSTTARWGPTLKGSRRRADRGRLGLRRDRVTREAHDDSSTR